MVVDGSVTIALVLPGDNRKQLKKDGSEAGEITGFIRLAESGPWLYCIYESVNAGEDGLGGLDANYFSNSRARWLSGHILVFFSSESALALALRCYDIAYN